MQTTHTANVHTRPQHTHTRICSTLTNAHTLAATHTHTHAIIRSSQSQHLSYHTHIRTRTLTHAHTHTPHVTTGQAAAHHTATQARAETQVIHTRTHLQSYKGIRTTIRPYSNTQSSAHTAEHAHTHTHKIRKHTIIHICSYKQ